MTSYASSDWPALPLRSTLVNKVHCMDALELLALLPDNSVDLVVTSPPYNLKMRSAGSKWNPQLVNGYDNHDDAMPHEQYVKWQREILAECLRVIPENGAIFYNHKWHIQNGLLDRREDIVSGFPVRQIIIWSRNGGMNFNNGYFVPSFEVVYLICKAKFELAKGANGFSDVWKIPHETNNDHPAPFPVAFAERCIKSTNAQIVLDPFGGSGTVSYTAQKLQRDWLTCDTSSHYCDLMERRLSMPFTPLMWSDSELAG